VNAVCAFIHSHLSEWLLCAGRVWCAFVHSHLSVWLLFGTHTWGVVCGACLFRLVAKNDLQQTSEEHPDFALVVKSAATLAKDVSPFVLPAEGYTLLEADDMIAKVAECQRIPNTNANASALRRLLRHVLQRCGNDFQWLRSAQRPSSGRGHEIDITQPIREGEAPEKWGAALMRTTVAQAWGALCAYHTSHTGGQLAAGAPSAPGLARNALLPPTPGVGARVATRSATRDDGGRA